MGPIEHDGHESDDDQFDAVHEAAERGEMTMGGLPPEVSPGAYSTRVAYDVFSEYKIYDFDFDWDGQDGFTFVLDEMWFDGPYRGWCHWEGSSVLVAHNGGGVTGHMATLAQGVPDEEQFDPSQPDWWNQMSQLILRAVFSPAAEHTIGE